MANKAGVSPAKERRPQDWSAQEQLLALHETHGLSSEALQAWCRERGLFAHHLTSWKAAFCAQSKTDAGSREVRALKDENEQLKRELVRKKKALAEAEALLILAMDMYEHSYQIDFGAAAAKYIKAFFQNIQWEEVARRLESTVKA